MEEKLMQVIGSIGRERASILQDLGYQDLTVALQTQLEKDVDNTLRRMKGKGLVKVVKESGRKPYWAKVGSS